MAWTLFLIYLLLTSYLGFLGMRRTNDFSTFAIGDGHMSPFIVGVTLAASTASAATFIINPGFVYVNGLSAFMHLGLAVFAGILATLFLVSYKFRRIGSEIKAVTIPNWLGKRYRSTGFAIYFSFINLFSFAFLVLLVGGISIVMQELLDISNLLALLITLFFVTGYVIIGGTYAHVYTNMLQGTLMAVVSLLVIYTGIEIMTDSQDFWSRIHDIDPNLTKPINPDSLLYNNYFSVYISGFLIGAALVCQPHILTKALYVKNDRDVTKFLMVFAITYLMFTLLLLAGFWALFTVPPENIMDPATGLLRQDLVMTQFLKVNFPDWLFTVISIVLLAAAMSTLDGLMVGLSTITANDLFVNLLDRSTTGHLTEADKFKKAFRASHIILVIMAILVFLVTLNPPALLGIYGQAGVYALVLSSLPPIINGIYFHNPNTLNAWVFSIIALVVYAVIYFGGPYFLEETVITYRNPAVAAAIAIIGTVPPAFIFQKYLSHKSTNHE